MSKVTNELTEMEELSRLLDEMNCGQEVQSKKQEINELLEIAEFIKESTIPVKPPQQLIDQTVDQIMADSVKRKKKSRHAWLFSGTLGTAAAVLLVVGFNIATIWPDKEQAVVLPPASHLLQEMTSDTSTGENPPAAEASPVRTEEPALPQIAINNTPSPTESTPVPTKAPIVTTKPMPVNPPPPPVAVESSPKKSVRPDTVREFARTAPLQKSASLSKQVLTPPLAVLSLPDRKPDSIIYDKENGTIRQIYAKGTPEEFTITQHAITLDDDTTTEKANSVSTPNTAKDTKQATTLHKVNITIHGQQVTIEGRQSEQELLKIVQTLTL